MGHSDYVDATKFAGYCPYPAIGSAGYGLKRATASLPKIGPVPGHDAVGEARQVEGDAAPEKVAC